MEFGPILFILLVAAVNFGRKKMEEAKRRQAETRTLAMGQAKRPSYPVQSPPGSLSSSTNWEDDSPGLGSLHEYRPNLETTLQSDPDRRIAFDTGEEQQLPSQARPAPILKPVLPKADAGILPNLNGATLLQAVIAKEILTRPPSATRPHGWTARKKAGEVSGP